MASNKAYSGSWQTVIAAGFNFGSNFSIQSVGREIKLKSIFISWNILDTVTGLNVAWRNTPFHNYILTLANTGPVIAEGFRQISGTAAYASGNIIEIREPGQVMFDGFFISNELLLNIVINNLSANACQYDTTVVIETEQKTIFL